MTICRSCGSKLGKPFLSLGNSPVSNAYLTTEQLHGMEPFYPLDVYVCSRCFLVQIEEYETAQQIFSADYAYFSSYSESWLQHCKNYTDMIVKRFGFNQDSFVVEIASNDGYLLQYFNEYQIPVLGVEPTANTAEIAIQKGIPTDLTFFNTAYAKEKINSKRLPDLIIGNNVLAHNPNLNDFVEGLRIALKPGGLITMEFPHLFQLMAGNQFDTIYQEHFSYFSLYSARWLFKAHGLEIFDVEELPTHGGSLRIYAKHNEDLSKGISKAVQTLLVKEEQAGLLDLTTYNGFSDKVRTTKRELLRQLIEIKNKGQRIVGYGAPAKGNTLLNYCGIRTDFIDYTVDRNPWKQGKYLPGTHISIKAPEVIREDQPDYIFILPWNIKDEIMEQLSFVRKWGGRFIIPIPEVKVV